MVIILLFITHRWVEIDTNFSCTQFTLALTSKKKKRETESHASYVNKTTKKNNSKKYESCSDALQRKNWESTRSFSKFRRSIDNFSDVGVLNIFFFIL